LVHIDIDFNVGRFALENQEIMAALLLDRGRFFFLVGVTSLLLLQFVIQGLNVVSLCSRRVPAAAAAIAYLVAGLN
jgi:hypothetical protein